MQRVNAVLKNEQYQHYLHLNEQWEENRIFCRHNLNHFLSVARIAYISVLEKHLNYSKELIYAAALLHDIGRWMEYDQGVNHNEASAHLAKEILEKSNFSKEEINTILEAILFHREPTEENSFPAILYYADKKSRNCFQCSVVEQCNWTKEKINWLLTD